MLAPPDAPIYRTRAERFDDLVLQAVAQLEPRWAAELSGVEFAVEEIPAAGVLADLPDPVPLARLDAGSGNPRDAVRPASPPRIVLFRRPLLARADGEEDLAAAIGRALDGVTDSPAFLDGRFTGTAGFHGIDLAAHCDQVTAALAHAAEVSAARIHRLLDTRVTGLPVQLAASPGPDAGLVAVHKRAAGEVHAMRRLAVATSVGTIETSGGQEDVQSFGWEAAEVLRAAIGHARAVTACELLTARQAIRLADRPAPPGCRLVLSWLDGLAEPIVADRPFGADIERIAAAPWPETP